MQSADASGATAAASGRLAIRVTVLCWFVVLLDGLDLFVYGAVLPGVLADHDFGLTPVTAGEIGSITTFGMLIGALGSGVITERVGRRRLIIAGVALFSLASAACALAPTPTTFGAARFAAGIGLGGLLPTAIALVMEYAPLHRKNLSITVVMTAHQAGGALAGALAMSVVESLGWRSVYWLGALPLVIALPLIVVLLPESLTYLLARGDTRKAQELADRHGIALEPFAPTAQPAGTRGGMLASQLRALFAPDVRTATLLFWITSFAGLLLVYGVNTWLPTMMRANGYNLGSAISFLLVINLGGIVGMLVAGRLADHFGARKVAVVWFALTACGVALMAVHLPLPLTYTVVFLTGAWLFSAQTLVYAGVGAYYPAGSRATALGWVAGVGRFGAVFGPWLGGVLVAGNLSALGFVVFAAAGVLGAAMIALVRQRQRPLTLAPG